MPRPEDMPQHLTDPSDMAELRRVQPHGLLVTALHNGALVLEPDGTRVDNTR